MSDDERTAGDWLGVTMADVAEAAGVSPSTVSRVLHGGAAVAASTRAAVLDAVRRTGYVENEAARRLAGGGHDSVGLLLRDPRNPVYGLLHAMLQLRSSEAGLQLLTVSPSANRGGAQEQTGLRRLMALRVRGILVATGVIRAEQLAPIVASIPAVVLGRPEEHPELDAVSYDERGNARIIVDAALAAGHRRLTVVVTPDPVSVSEHLRSIEMIRALRAAGADVEAAEAPLFGSDDALNARLVEAARDGRRTAILFPTDARLLRFAERARDAGLRIPEDVSVAGLDGILPGLSLLGITTVRMPVETVARRGIERIVERIAEPALPVLHEQHVGELVPGRTLGPAPRR